MAKTLHPWTWRRLGLAGGLALPILLPLGSAKAGPPAGPIFRAQATQPQPQPVKPEPVSTTPPTQVAPVTATPIPPPAGVHAADGAVRLSGEYTLAECIQIALQQQPAVNA